MNEISTLNKNHNNVILSLKFVPHTFTIFTCQMISSIKIRDPRNLSEHVYSIIKVIPEIYESNFDQYTLYLGRIMIDFRSYFIKLLYPC